MRITITILIFIIAALRPVKSILELIPEERQQLSALIYKLRKGMQVILGFDQVILFPNEASKYDFHIWMLPKHPWMKEFKSQKMDSYIDYAKENMATEDKATTKPLPSSKSDRQFGPKKKLTPEY